MLYFDTFYRIEAPHFVAGVEIRRGFVYKAAPIVKYMKGWQYWKVLAYCSKKNWKCDAISI